jgi:hypothetical protein
MEIGADKHNATTKDTWAYKVALVLLVKEHMDN